MSYPVQIINWSPQKISNICIQWHGNDILKYYTVIQIVILIKLLLILQNVGVENAYPSVYSACKRPRYDSHLFPTILPQVKHLTGIIILTYENINKTAFKQGGIKWFTPNVMTFLSWLLCESLQLLSESHDH